ncbi:MAG: 30S ribosome-binding factor RbfA [Thermovirgaceae bacterium]
MTHFRIERINRELLRELSELLKFEIKDETAKKAVLVEVDCSKDLGHAKVYYTTLATEEREAVQKSLERASGVLRGIIGRQMRLRKVPELHFIPDRVEEEARKIEAVLDSLKQEDEKPENGTDDGES